MKCLCKNNFIKVFPAILKGFNKGIAKLYFLDVQNSY